MDMLVEVHHKDGVKWYEAPAPRKRHKHWGQTWGRIGLDYIDRCACGARSRRDGVWVLLDKPRVSKPKHWWNRRATQDESRSRATGQTKSPTNVGAKVHLGQHEPRRRG